MDLHSKILEARPLPSRSNFLHFHVGVPSEKSLIRPWIVAVRDARQPLCPIFFIFMKFSRTIDQSNRLVPPTLGLATSGKSWIRPCMELSGTRPHLWDWHTRLAKYWIRRWYFGLCKVRRKSFGALWKLSKKQFLLVCGRPTHFHALGRDVLQCFTSNIFHFHAVFGKILAK